MTLKENIMLIIKAIIKTKSNAMIGKPVRITLRDLKIENLLVLMKGNSLKGRH